MAANADVQEGDLLTTSGVDGVYPPGLPVAKVDSVERRADSAFARISLRAAGAGRRRAPRDGAEAGWRRQLPAAARAAKTAPRPRQAGGKPAQGGPTPMIMRPGQQQLLLPRQPLFIWVSLLLALLLNMLPLGPRRLDARLPGAGAGVLERAPAAARRHRRGLRVRPAAWTCTRRRCWASMRWPTRRSSFFAITIHRRLLWFTVPSQAVQVLPLFAAGAR